jgi:hypothetical protein
MKSAKLMSLLLGLGLALGCRAVYVTEPVGEKPVELKAEEWEGTWKIVGKDDGFYAVRVTDAKAGRLEIAGIDTEKEGFKLETFQALIRQHKDWQFLNVKDKDKPEYYTWCRIKNEGKQAIVWVPDMGKIEALIKNGKLPGKTLDKNDLLLGPLTAKHLDLLTTDSQGVLLDWEEPTILLRCKK